MLIDTPLLVVGHGPAPLVVAKVASGWGLASVVAGHEGLGGDEPVELDAEAVAVLTPHGVLDVLRPYLASVDPPAIAPSVFEQVLKHHCVADMNVTVYDGLDLVERCPGAEVAKVGSAGGASRQSTLELHSVTGVLSDGRSRWEVRADVFVDAGMLPRDLTRAIRDGSRVARAVLDALI